jgi:hypothetical protein
MLRISALNRLSHDNKRKSKHANENFDFVIFALSENFIFSDHFNTNLVENFELSVLILKLIVKK